MKADDFKPDQRLDDFERGVRNRRAVLGDAWVDQSLGGATEFNADFQSLTTRYAWNEIWGRPGLDHPTRRLLVLGMTMALARWEEFELHCRAAVRGGVAPALIKEALLQGAIYCGVPAANTGFKLATQILRDEGLLPPPQPLTAAQRVATHDTFSQPQLRVALQGVAGADATPVVLSHALGLDLRLWDGLAAELAVTHRVLRYDQRGHGSSAVPAGPYTIDELVDDAARLLREWGAGPVVWVGLSMGGMVGQGLAIRHPELLRGLVLANTCAKYPESAQPAWAERIAKVQDGGVAAIADSVIERYFSAGFRAAQPAVVDAFRQVLLRTNPMGYAACCAAIAHIDWLGRLHQIACPTLIIAGAEDVGTPVAMSEAMAERIGGAQLVVLENAAHLSAVEQPLRFAEHLQRFLARMPR